MRRSSCSYLDGNDVDRKAPTAKCALCANAIIGTPIFALDRDNVCHVARGNECTFDIYGKVPGKERCDPNMRTNYVTVYVLGSRLVRMHGFGIEIRSSILCEQAGMMKEVPLPKDVPQQISTVDATGLLSLTVQEVAMERLPEIQMEKIKDFLVDLANETVFTLNITETSDFLHEYVNATTNLMASGYLDGSSKASQTAASEVQQTFETLMGRAAQSLQGDISLGIHKGAIVVEISSRSALTVMKKGAHLPQIQNFMTVECKIPSSYFSIKHQAKMSSGTTQGETDFDAKREEIQMPELKYVSFVSISMSREASNLPLQLEVEDSNDTIVTMTTNVVTFSTSVKEPVDVPQPVVITLQHDVPENNDTNNGTHRVESECVFWNYSLSADTGGAWSTKGCKVHSHNTTHTVCHCDHMTSFAVLMKFTPSGESMLLLDIVTYIGVSVSILCLLTTFGIFLYLSDILHSERTTIHKNLMVAIGLGQLIFISGINVTYDQITCTVIAVLLHLFFLASFMWMLAEGIHLYAKVIYVFTGGRNLLPLFYTLGWGFPIIVVAVSAGIRIDGYGTKQYCWLSIEDGLIWAFIGPALCVIAANLLIIIMVVRIVILSAGSIPQTKDPKKTTQAWSAIKGIVILTPILGVSWLFGFLAVNRHLLVFEFLFTFFNAFQGLFIFLFHCVGNSEVRAAFKRKREQSSLSKELQSGQISTPTTGKSTKMPIQIIVMSQYEGSQTKLGSCGCLGSTCSRTKVAPCSYKGISKPSNQRVSKICLKTVDGVTSPRKVNITIEQQFTDIEDDFESFDSIGASVSSGESMSTTIGHGKEGGNMTEVECPSHYILTKSRNTHMPHLPFVKKPVLYKRKSMDQY